MDAARPLDAEDPLHPQLTLYAQGENLVTWTGYTGADPEVNGAQDVMSYPKPRTITFGVDMNF